MKKNGTSRRKPILCWILCLVGMTFLLKKMSNAGEENGLSLCSQAMGRERQSTSGTEWLMVMEENDKVRVKEKREYVKHLENEGLLDGAGLEPDANELQAELAEKVIAQGEAVTVIREKVNAISPEQMDTYAALVKNFYVIDPTTTADENLLNPELFLRKNLCIDKTVEGPQILIYHTHSQEAFLDSEPGDPRETVVGVGEELARILEEQYGYQVLHHEGKYDIPTRNGAYSRALPEIQRILTENPSIQVVIDLHRDEMPENVHLVTEIDGKKTARFMFFNGLSRTKKTGPLEYLENEYIMDNLAFSFQMEKAAQEYFPNLTRKIYLKGYRYNMHVCPRTLLVELGAQNNTLEEAINACVPLAFLLDQVLSGEEITE